MTLHFQPQARHWCNRQHAGLPNRWSRGSTGMAHQPPLWARDMKHGGGAAGQTQMPGVSLHVPALTLPFPPWCHQQALDPVEVAEPVRIRPGEPFHSTSCTRQRSRAIELQPQVIRCESGVHVHFQSKDVEPDKRAGAVSKTECASRRHGEHALRFPPFLSHCVSVAQQTESAALRTRRLRVQVLPETPTPFISPCSPTAETTASEAVRCGCKSCLGDHFQSFRSSAELEHRRAEAEAAGANPAGSAISRNVNLTSAWAWFASPSVPRVAA